MKLASILTLVALFLAGCATLRPAERNLLTQHHIALPVYQKMVNYEPLALAEIVELSKRKVPPPFIIRYVRDTGVVYYLRTEDVLQLQMAGVKSDVIDYLLTTPTIAASYYASPRYSDYPFYYGYSPVIVVREHHHHH